MRNRAPRSAGRLKVRRTLHSILATLSTPLARPVVAPVRLRRGNASDARSACPFTAEALAAAKQAGATGTVVVRADSQFFNARRGSRLPPGGSVLLAHSADEPTPRGGCQ